MAKRPNKHASLTREELDAQINTFLKRGGKIDKIPSGVSGAQSSKGPRHIRIS